MPYYHGNPAFIETPSSGSVSNIITLSVRASTYGIGRDIIQSTEDSTLQKTPKQKIYKPQSLNSSPYHPQMIWLFNPWNITKSDKSCNTLIHLLFIPYLQVFSIKNQRRQWQPTPVLLPGKSHGWRSLVGYSPWGRKELDMTEQLHFHFHSLEKEMATHSSVLAWRIPGTGEPGGLPSMGWHRVGHD